MGYTTDFSGEFNINKPLGDKIKQFLKLFNETRRMGREEGDAFGVEGEFYVFGEGSFGQAKDGRIIDYNKPPSTQPALWCGWTPNEDGTAIVWDESEKFYCYVEWLVYLINKILAPNGYVLNGVVQWQGEENGDVGEIFVNNNVVTSKEWKGELVEHTIENCTVYAYPESKINFMRPDIVLILNEDDNNKLDMNTLFLTSETVSDKKSCEMKDEIEKILIIKWNQFGMDIPDNFEDIVQFCYEDVLETADPINWHEGDVSIAFRRWVESK